MSGSASSTAASDCSTCVLSNTVRPYQMHIILCDQRDPVEWPDRVENYPAVGAFLGVVEDFSRSGQPKEIKLTCCTYTPSEVLDESLMSLVIYPSGVIVSFHPTKENILAVMSKMFELITCGSQSITSDDAEEALSSLDSVLVRKAPWEILILVCCHASRDKRCGRAGPQVLQALDMAKVESGADHVQILPSSHIGGHKFAGTLVVYPSGHWYGHISKSNTKELLMSILANDTPNVKCFRGHGFGSLEF